MSDYKTIRFEVSNGVATITLNRPEGANSINMELAKELMQAAISCDKDKAIRAVLITADGKIFCPGADLKYLASQGDEIAGELAEVATYWHTATAHFARMSAPVIIAVNGTAAGAGFSLAISGDIVLASESAKFTMAYTGVGLSPDGAASYNLPRLIGLRRTQELMLTNRLLSASEALEWGLLTRVVSAEELLSEARAMAEKFAKGPTLAYGTVKKLLMASFDSSIEGQMELEARGITEMSATTDGKEGIKAFLEKSKANFCGS